MSTAYADRTLLDAKFARASAIVENRRRLERIKFELQGVKRKLLRAIEHERRYSPMTVEHCFAAGLLHDVAALAADLELLEIN